MRPAAEPRTLVLTERAPRVCRLAPDDVAFLVEHHGPRLELLPTGRRDRYRLTVRGCAGVIVAPRCRLVIRPKIPMTDLFALLDPLAHVPSSSDEVRPDPGGEELDFLAGQLAIRLAERAAAGLQRGYRERAERGPVLHGSLDLPAQLRQAPARKDQLHSHYDDFTADVLCNRVPRATAEAVLASPLLGRSVRAALLRVLNELEAVQRVPLSPEVWAAVEPERVPPEYRPLLELCRLLGEGLAPGGAVGSMAAPAFLLDMDRVFERYVTRGVVDAFAASPCYTVAVQTAHIVNRPAAGQPQVSMRPDLTIDRDGRPVLALDAKWKRMPPRSVETPDLYQVLSYGTALGAGHVVLVYPGRRTRAWEYAFTHTPLRLAVHRLRVTGGREACARSLRRLARDLKRYLRGLT